MKGEKELSQEDMMKEMHGKIAEIHEHLGIKKKKPTEPDGDLGEEIADIIFALICLANSEQIDLDEKLQWTIDKAWGRDSERFPRKENPA